LSATGHGTGEAARKGSLLVRARLSAFRSYKLRLSWTNAEERTAVHICYGYGIKANNDWKATLGEHWRQYEETFPALAASRIDQVSLECRNARVPIELIGLLKGKDVLIGCIDVASDVIETPQDLADTIRAALDHVPPERLYLCTNCGMAADGGGDRLRQACGARGRCRARAQGCAVAPPLPRGEG
jgi:5-methyltetrahydropteroyltriglutamate--homocysteine methyltransferase